MDATKTVDELLDHIGIAMVDLDPKEQVMVLCTVGEHCKAYADTILAHEYHAAIYGRRKVSDR